MADPNAHAGTIADPIPQQLLYKNAKDGKIYTVAGAASSSSAPAPKVENANETTKGITKLSDAIDSDSDAATGVTAATPKAVKDALEQAKAYTDANSGGTGTTVDATDTVKGISKLSDATDSALDASTGKTAATPKAVKDAMNVAKLALAQAGGVVTPDIPPKVELPGTIIEAATDKKIGTVKLSDATNSSSDAATGKTAASSKAVMEAMDKAKEALRVAQAGGGGQIVSVEDATDAVKGIVSLSDATDSKLDAATGKFAATPKAVKAAMDKANEALALAGGNPDGNPIEGTKIESATDVKLGVTKLSDETASNADAATGTTAATPKAVMKAYDLANKAFKLAEANAGTAGGGSIALPDDADATTKGVVKLSDAVNSDSDVDGLTAATPKAVKTALEQAKAYADTLGGGGGSGPTVDATDAVKGVSKLSDAIDSDLNAATGKTAATPLAVKQVNTKVTNLNSEFNTHKQTLNSYDKRLNALESAGGTIVVLTPKIVSPKADETSVLTTFTISGNSYINLLESDVRKHRRFEISLNKSFDSLLWFKEVDADSVEVSPPVPEHSSMYIRIRDESSQGFISPWSTVHKITTVGESKVSKPTLNLSGDTTVAKENPIFYGSPFNIEPEEQNDPKQHISTTWILTKTDTQTQVWKSEDDTKNKVHLLLDSGILEVSTNYTMEMIYNSKDHGSSEKVKVDFTTAASFNHIQTPAISIAGDDLTDVPLKPSFTTSTFITNPPDIKERHTATTWWITRKSGEEVWRLDLSQVKLTLLQLDKTLDADQDYIIHVIYHGSSIARSAEASLEFHTTNTSTGDKPATIILLDGNISNWDGRGAFKATGQLNYTTGESTISIQGWSLYEGSSKIFENNWYTGNFLCKIAAGSTNDTYYKLKPSTQYRLVYKYRSYNSSNPSSDYTTSELYFTTAAQLRKQSIEVKVNSTPINFSKVFTGSNGWSASRLVFFKNGVQDDTIRANFSLEQTFDEDTIIRIENLDCEYLDGKDDDVKNLWKPVEYSGMKNSVVEILGPLPPMALNKGSFFHGSTSLKKLCKDIFTYTHFRLGGMSDRDNGYGVFSNCTKLTELPENLLNYCTDSSLWLGGFSLNDDHSFKVIHGAFSGCTGLTKLPKLDSNLGKELSLGARYQASPEKNITTKDITVLGAFSNCTSLKELPEDLFASQNNFIIYFGPRIEFYSSSISNTFTNDLSNLQVKGAFSGCTSLHSIPQNLIKLNYYGASNTSYLGGVLEYQCDRGSYNPTITLNGIKVRGAFEGCSNLSNVNLNLYHGKASQAAIYFGAVAKMEPIFSNGILVTTKIYAEVNGAFNDCVNLTTIKGNLKSCHNCSYMFGAYGYCYNTNKEVRPYLKLKSAFSGNSSISSVTYECLNTGESNSILNLHSWGLGTHPENSLDGYVTSYGVFESCSKLLLNVSIDYKNINNVENFAKDTKGQGTVRVPKNSTTAYTFKSDPTANVNVIEV